MLKKVLDMMNKVECGTQEYMTALYAMRQEYTFSIYVTNIDTSYLEQLCKLYSWTYRVWSQSLGSKHDIHNEVIQISRGT